MGSYHHRAKGFITSAGESKHRRKKEMIIYATPLPLTSETEKSYYA
ncbi:MAG: hypothetical protein WBM69_18915 [Desulfobacterales bacterium]